jgi:hypothetical protein
MPSLRTRHSDTTLTVVYTVIDPVKGMRVSSMTSVAFVRSGTEAVHRSRPFSRHA